MDSEIGRIYRERERMMRDQALESLRERFRIHLESEGRILTDVAAMMLSPQEVSELLKFISRMAKEAMEKYPAYKTGIMGWVKELQEGDLRKLLEDTGFVEATGSSEEKKG
jgi:hypothetical protein